MMQLQFNFNEQSEWLNMTTDKLLCWLNRHYPQIKFVKMPIWQYVDGDGIVQYVEELTAEKNKVTLRLNVHDIDTKKYTHWNNSKLILLDLCNSQHGHYNGKGLATNTMTDFINRINEYIDDFIQLTS